MWCRLFLSIQCSNYNALSHLLYIWVSTHLHEKGAACFDCFWAFCGSGFVIATVCCTRTPAIMVLWSCFGYLKEDSLNYYFVNYVFLQWLVIFNGCSVARHMDPVCGFLTPSVNRTNCTSDADGFMKPDQRFHSHLQLCVPNDAGYFRSGPRCWRHTWLAMRSAVKCRGGMWSNIHEMLKGEVLQTILDSILLGISH